MAQLKRKLGKSCNVAPNWNYDKNYEVYIHYFDWRLSRTFPISKEFLFSLVDLGVKLVDSRADMSHDFVKSCSKIRPGVNEAITKQRRIGTRESLV